MPIVSMHPVGGVRKFRRSAETVCSATLQNSYHKYHIIPHYNWNQILKFYLGLFQMCTFLRRPE